MVNPSSDICIPTRLAMSNSTELKNEDKGKYTFGHAAAVTKAHAVRLVSTDSRHLVPHLKPHHRILDIGCGPASITVDFLAGGYIDPDKGGSVTGIEPESTGDAILQQARAHAIERGVSNGIHFEHGDIHTLDQFADGSWDVVHVSQVFFHISDSIRALQAIKRVLKPGTGILSLREADFITAQVGPQDPTWDEWKRYTIDLYRSNGGHPDAGSNLLAWLGQAGYDLSRMELSADPFVYTNLPLPLGAPPNTLTAKAWAETTVGRSLLPKVREQVDQKLKDGVKLGDVKRFEETEKFWDLWRVWGERKDAFFTITNTQVIARV